jgi:hypothetical protein
MKACIWGNCDSELLSMLSSAMNPSVDTQNIRGREHENKGIVELTKEGMEGDNQGSEEGNEG